MSFSIEVLPFPAYQLHALVAQRLSTAAQEVVTCKRIMSQHDYY
jgi:hypothetical protein